STQRSHQAAPPPPLGTAQPSDRPPRQTDACRPSRAKSPHTFPTPIDRFLKTCPKNGDHDTPKRVSTGALVRSCERDDPGRGLGVEVTLLGRGNGVLLLGSVLDAGCGCCAVLAR